MRRELILALTAIAITNSTFGLTPTPARYVASPMPQLPAKDLASQSAQSPLRAADLSDGANTEIRVVDGRKQYVTVSGWGFVDTNKGLTATSFDMTSDIVYGEDGYIYIHAPLGGTTSAYVRGVPAEDGKSFTVQYPQIINTVSAYDKDGVVQHYPVIAQVMECYVEEDENGMEYSTYDPVDDETLNLIKYSIGEDGTVKMEPPLQERFETDDRGYVISPKYILSEHVTVPSYVLTPGASSLPQTLWLGPGCINVSYNALPSDIISVEVPDNLEWNGNWIAQDAQGSKYPITVALDNDKIYIGGLSQQGTGIKDVFIGIINGNQVTFPNRQLLGYDNLNHELIYLMCATGSEEFDPDYNETYIAYQFTGKDYVMGYDPETQQIYNIQPNGALMISASFKRTDYYYTALYEPIFENQDNNKLNASPTKPTFVDWNDYIEKYGVYQVAVRIPYTNVNGALLNTSDMYYTIFVNGEPYYFNGQDNGFPEDFCLVPYDANTPDIFNQGTIKSIYLHIPAPYMVSAQSYFIGTNGQTYASERTDQIVGGINDITTDIEQGSRKYIDISGRAVNSPTPGAFVIELTRMSDGTTKTQIIRNN